MWGGWLMKHELVLHTEDRMKHAIAAIEKDYGQFRTGRANPAILEKVMVDSYGAQMPLNQLANIGVPEPRLLLITPWDKSQIPAIERAISKSDLGMTPQSDGNVIRLTVPYLTEERRNDLIKQLHRRAEEGRVEIRNMRREGNESLKKLEKNKEISEDECGYHQDEIQKVTDQFIKEVDKVTSAKEHELREV
jgi:ribosome recycling factor